MAFTLLDLLTATAGDVQTSGLSADVSSKALMRVVTDHRDVRPGDVFWGLQGSKLNGSKFASHALKAGAAGVVVDCETKPVNDRWVVRVPDTLRALEQLAATVRAGFDGTVIAVTGSVGKTTTREMIHAALGATFRGKASPKNFNNHVGLPLSMLTLEPEHDYLAVEIGASAPGEIARLSALAKPHIGIITSVGQAHLGGFGGQEALANAKAELLEALPEDGLAILPHEDRWLRKLAGKSRASVLWAGRGNENTVTAQSVRCQDGWLEWKTAGVRYRVRSWGRHHLTSGLIAVAVGQWMGLAPRHVARGLEEFVPCEMRCQPIERSGITILNDAYNASPTSMRAALEMLRDWNHAGRKIAVLGDMRELGTASTEYHRRVGDQVVTVCGADRLIACGEHAATVVASARQAGMPFNRTIACRSREAASGILRDWARPGDAVLIKGSRVLEMEKLVSVFEDEPPALRWVA